MNFKERLKPTVQTKALLSAVPYIIISRQALDKMFAYVDGCADEIGWLGTAYREGREIYIQDTYLFDQEVHATTTEITPEGLSSFAMELLEQSDGVDIWNNMKMWGHSHVRMGVTPSGQDDAQMATFQEGGHDWFIRLIANKNGELKVDLYEYTNGLIYLDLPWEAEIVEEEDNIKAEMARLQKQLDELHGTLSLVHTAGISEEMKVKVRKKATHQYHNNSNWASRSNSQTSTTTTQNGSKTGSGTDDAKKKDNSEKNSVQVVNENEPISDFFQRDEEVREEFGFNELMIFASLDKFEDVVEELEGYGLSDCFTMKDVERIIRVSRALALKVYGGLK